MARADRVLALVGFLLIVTALLLPWWRFELDTPGDRIPPDRSDVHAYRPEPPLTTYWAPLFTGILAATAALDLFVRLAANSHVHEPRKWRRDLGGVSGVLLTAAASCLFWPAAVPSFWGGRTYSEGGVQVVETAMPGLGWWLAVVAGLLCAVAFWKAGKHHPESTGPES